MYIYIYIYIYICMYIYIFFFSINITVQHTKLKSQSPDTKILKCLGINKNNKIYKRIRIGSKYNKTFKKSSGRI